MRLHFYLKPQGRVLVEQGVNTMPSRVVSALRQAGWEITLCPDAERVDIPNRDGHHLVVNVDPGSERCLVLRIAGFEPFWRIERTNQPWDWDTAARAYEPPNLAQDRIDQFLATWRKQVLRQQPGGKGGGVLVPLQGRLTETRVFQAASPAVMLHQVLKQWSDRPVLATTHSSETYDADDLEVLDRLKRDFPRLKILPGTPKLLADCDQVVTENSNLAFKGFLLDKPAMLWAQIDWHHVAASVPRDGMERAFAEAGRRHDYGRYLFWYLRRQSLWAWEDNPKAIRNRLRDLGWPVPEPK